MTEGRPPHRDASRNAFRSRRALGVLMIALLVVTSAQVYWWVLDQRRQAADQEAAWSVFAEESPTARARLTELRAKQSDRRYRYAWEAAFFLAVLTASIAVIWRGMFEDLAARRRQEIFLALVSHQFKTPVAAMRLAIETILLRCAADPEVARLAWRAIDDLQRLEDLVNNILESARLDQGRVVLRRQPLSPGQYADRVLDRLADRAARAAVRLANNVGPELQVVADPVAMDAVLRNLVENAIASVAPAGGGDVEVSAALEGGRVAVVVRDNGSGFEPGEADGLFEKFGKSHLASSPRERSGLGLYVVRRMMEFSGGSVNAASAGKGRGATFTVRWPSATGHGA